MERESRQDRERWCGCSNFRALTCPAAAIPERSTSAAQRQSLTVIVYADFALVRDVRRLNVDRGQNRVVFDDVSPQMDPTTAFLTDLSAGAPIWVHEHNFETAILSPDAIFARAVGHKVLVVRYDQMPGRETRETAVVLSTNGPILQFKDRIETGLPPSSRIAYLSIPSVRRTRGFVFDFESPQGGARPVGLAYLTGGLSWSADYVARLNQAGGDFQTQDGGEQRPDVQVRLEFENDGDGLGVPGLGPSFEVAARRVQTEYREIPICCAALHGAS